MTVYNRTAPSSNAMFERFQNYRDQSLDASRAIEEQIQELQSKLKRLQTQQTVKIEAGMAVWFRSKTLEYIRGYIVCAPNSYHKYWHGVRPAMGESAESFIRLDGPSIFVNDAANHHYMLETFDGTLHPFSTVEMPKV